VAASAPLLGQFDEPLADRDRHPHRPGGVVLLELRIVEEDHDPVAGKVLEGALVLDDQPADRRVVAAQEPEHLLGLSGLRERREVAEVAEHRGDLAAVTREKRLALRALHELGDLRRQEPGQLASLALDRQKQPGVRGADRGLLRETGREGPLSVVERTDLVARQRDHAADRPALLHRNTEDRPVAADLLTGRREVLAVGQDVLDLDRIAEQRHPTDDAVATGPDRVLPLPVVELRRPATGRGDAVRAPVQDVRRAVIGATQPDSGADRRVEHDLELERRAAHDRQDLIRRGLPLDRLALRIMQPLAGQRRGDPGLEDRRVDGLGQVIRGAHLQASDDAVELVDAGDHDDRDVPESRVVAQLGEHLVPVHLGHDDVEEDHVDRRLARVAEPVQRLPPVPGLDRLVPDPAEEAGEELAVEVGVVDDEDPTGSDRAVSGRWGHAVPPAVAGRARAIAASSSSGRIGLLT
jgi:hypothetical protein